MKVRLRRLLRAVAVGLAWTAGLFAVLQLVPYGRSHSNPPVTKEPAWDSPRTRELAVRACFDCHSNKTTWPAYSNVAPLSWIVQHDVEAARSTVNFSEWDVPYALAEYCGSSTRDGNMPPKKYLMAHPEANLTAAETQELARGLDATIKNTQSRR
jgi:mono/diheme cytochrome c family protein